MMIIQQLQQQLQQQHHLPLRQDRLRGDRSIGQSTQEKTNGEYPGWQAIHSLGQGTQAERGAYAGRHHGCHR